MDESPSIFTGLKELPSRSDPLLSTDEYIGEGNEVLLLVLTNEGSEEATPVILEVIECVKICNSEP